MLRISIRGSPLYRLAAAEEMSVDAAVVAVLSQRHCVVVFFIVEEEKQH